MRRPLTLALLLSLTACATYRPKPLNPARTDDAFRHRTLSDPNLLAYIHRHDPTTTPAHDQPWTLSHFTLAAFYSHPDLILARAQLRTAAAAIETAGAHPNPTLSLAPGWESVHPPFLFNAALDLPIETAGKRERRIDQARALSDAARLHIDEVAWQIRASVRTALVDYLLTRDEAASLQVETDARTSVATVLEQRLAVGSISQPELDLSLTEVATALLALRSAQGRLAETTAALAAAIGVPASALDNITCEWPVIELPPPRDVAPAAAQKEALLARVDLRKSLAEYAASEAELRLQIAKQYPDLQISPGYAFDQGANKYTIGLAMTLPIFDQNQGPIAEAESKREEAAAQFLGLQIKVIGQTQLAIARYNTAMNTLAEADHILTLAKQRETSVQQAFDAGQSDRLALNGVHVEVAVAARSRIDTLRTAQSALGALEDALQQPLGQQSAPTGSVASESNPGDPTP